MTRKFFLIITLALCTLVLSVVEGLNFALCTDIFAAYTESLNNYTSAFEKYRFDYQEYSKSKNSYLTYNTLNSQTEALNKTKILLESRSDTLISYFKLLDDVLKQTEGITDFDKSLSSNIINNRLILLQNHKESISAINSLSDVIQKSKEIDSKKMEIQVEGDKIIGTIIIGEVEKLDKELLVSQGELSDIIIQIKSQGNDTTKLERWQLETNNKLQLTNLKLQEARNTIDNLNPDEQYKEKQDFLNAKKLVSESRQYLKEADLNLKEAIADIKSGRYK